LLAAKLEGYGYGIRRTEQHFELASVSREPVEKFSRRTGLIEQRARDKYKVLEAQARALTKSTNMAFDESAIRSSSRSPRSSNRHTSTLVA
jgi:hypothetical protein